MNFKMSIKNYKSFKSKQEITFAPITIFVGPNSGGKSSILKLLGFLKQNILSESYSTNKNRVIYSGHFADLRNFNSMAHKHNEQPIEIELETPRAAKQEALSGAGFEFYNEKTRFGYLLNKVEATPSFKFYNADTFDDNYNNFFGKYYPQKESKELLKGKYKISNHTKEEIKKELKSLKPKFLDCLSFITGKDLESSEKRWDEFNKIQRTSHLLYSHGFNLNPNSFNFLQSDTPIWEYYKNNPQFFQLFIFKFHAELDNKEHVFSGYTDRFNEADCFNNTNFAYYCEKAFNYRPFNTNVQENKNVIKIFSEELDIFDNISNVYKNHLNPELKKTQLVVLENMLWHSLLEIYIKHYIKEYESIRTHYESHVKPTLHALMSNLHFLPPVRKSPQEIYSEKELIATLLGETSPILDEEVPSNNWIKSDIENILKDVELVNHYITSIGLTQQIEIRKISDNSISTHYVLELTDKSNGHTSTLNEVGYGFSQILPILFSIKNYYTGQTIVIEQPELHLHPALQSKFSEILADAIVNGRGLQSSSIKIDDKFIPVSLIDQNSVVVETHSEHIIRGIQVQIAQGKISKEDVAVNFVGKYKNGNSFVKRMHLTDTGMFKEDWPGGLFEDSYQQSLELLKRQ